VILPLTWRRGVISSTQLYTGVVLCIPLAAIWFARGVATSGCLAYPSPTFCLPVPWRISLATAQFELEWARSWARTPGVKPEIVLADWSWLPDWIHRLTQDFFFGRLVGLAIIAGICPWIIAGICLWRRPRFAEVRTVWRSLTDAQKLES